VAELAGFNRFHDLPLLLGPLLWTAWFASAGAPRLPRLLALVLAVLLARSAALIAYAPEATDLRQLPPERRPLALLFGVGALCFGLPLGWAGLLVPAAWGALAGWFVLRRRSYLSDPLLAVALALPAIMGWLTQGGAITKAGGLVVLAILLWLMAALIVSPAQRAGATLVLLVPGRAPLAAAVLKLAALGALALAGRQEHLGIFFQLGLLAALGLALYQAWTARRAHPPAAAVLEAWWGVAVFCGIAFHFLCACQAAAQV
jgi:4-hydroxybenzoate polyprenyltransferase